MTEPTERAPRWFWPAAVVVVLVALVGAYVYSLWTARAAAERAVETVAAVSEKAVEIAERFQTRNITTTFTSSIPTLASAGSGRLEVATLEATETFVESAETKMFWDYFSLGETVTEIRLPATYRYHVELADEWRLEVDGQTCLVVAPPLRPSLPVAIDTAGIEKRTQAGWLDFEAEQQMQALEKSLTTRLALAAHDERRLTLARNAARETVASFVRDWLLREDHWREDRFRTIVVRFADEPATEERAPTLEYTPLPGP